MSIVIAIDGPAAAGKGTLARRLADHYGYAYLDTGLLYRKVGYLVLAAGGDPGDEAAAVTAAQGVGACTAAEADLRTGETGKAASLVAAHPGVRQALLEFQRGFARTPPDGLPGAVIDGRDIGTVVCPCATVKLFVTASAEERARRRHAELRAAGDPVSFETVLADVEARDERDRTRAVAPLVPADSAHLLDTTSLSIEAVFKAACTVVDAAVTEAR